MNYTNGSHTSTLVLNSGGYVASNGTILGAHDVSVNFDGPGYLEIIGSIEQQDLGNKKYLSASGTCALPHDSYFLKMRAIGGAVTIHSITVSYLCDNNLPTYDAVIDGSKDDSLWINGSLGALNGAYIKYNNDYNSKLYSQITSAGLYVFAETSVRQLKATTNTGYDNYFDGENLELQLYDALKGTNISTMMNKIYCSKRLGDEGHDKKLNNVTTFAFSDYQINPSTGLYEYNVELFISWADLSAVSGGKITNNTHIVGKIGLNLTAGWFATGMYEFKTSGAEYLRQHVETWYDGVMNEGYWNAPLDDGEVGVFTFLIRHNDQHFSYVHQVRDYFGIHFFVEQYSDTQPTIEEWWQTYNIELTRTDNILSTYAYIACSAGKNGFDCYMQHVSMGYGTYPTEVNGIGLYEAHFEFFISYVEWFDDASQYRYNGPLYVGRYGFNHSSFGGGWAQTDTTVRDIRGHNTINFMPILPYYGYSVGNELINASITRTETIWNTTVFTNNSESNVNHSVELLFKASYQNNDADNWGATFACEIYSPGWANGGVTFRGDWWGWGIWINGYGSEDKGDSERWIHDQTRFALNSYGEVKKNMQIIGRIGIYNMDNNQNVVYCLQWILDQNGIYLGLAYWVAYGTNNYRGTICFGLGSANTTSDHTVTITSAKLITY